MKQKSETILVNGIEMSAILHGKDDKATLTKEEHLNGVKEAGGVNQYLKTLGELKDVPLKEDAVPKENFSELYSHMHTLAMIELRESNMAFDELLERVPTNIIRQAFYELKEIKLQNKIAETESRIKESKTKNETSN